MTEGAGGVAMTPEERAAKRRAYMREYLQRWRVANPEKAREYSRKYREANRERVRERNRKYYEGNREMVRERVRKYYEAHCERVRERKRKYYEAHRERVRERKQKYYKAHRERLLEAARKYHERNRDRMAEYFRKRHEARRAAWDAFFRAEGRTQCLACGYSEDFRNIHEHHVAFPKLFAPSEFTTRRPYTPENADELRGELEKCIPLCAYCHRAYHGKKGRAKVTAAIMERFIVTLADGIVNQGGHHEPK